MKVRFTKQHGKITNGRDQLLGVEGSLPDGEWLAVFVSLSDPHTVEEWRKLYFHLRDLIHDAVETGYTKKELHKVFKNQILEAMWLTGNTEWFVDGELPELSTKHLNALGWKEYVTRLKQISMDTFEFYI